MNILNSLPLTGSVPRQPLSASRTYHSIKMFPRRKSVVDFDGNIDPGKSNQSRKLLRVWTSHRRNRLIHVPALKTWTQSFTNAYTFTLTCVQHIREHTQEPSLHNLKGRLLAILLTGASPTQTTIMTVRLSGKNPKREMMT